MKKVTYGQFINAVERDGLPKVTGTLFRSKPRGVDAEKKLVENFYDAELIKKEEFIGAACAVGQACINLGIREPHNTLTNFIINLNDSSKATLPEIAKKAREKFIKHLDEDFYCQEFDYMPYVKKEVYQPKEVANASVG